MPVTKAIILAGGMDPGLFPWSDPLPKALLPVADIPLLHYVIANLRDHGVREVFIACNAQDERLFRESCAPWMKEIRISVIAESFPMGTAGALQPIGSRIAGEPLWVLEVPCPLRGRWRSSTSFTGPATVGRPTFPAASISSVRKP
ncbi:MAG: NDP-sugar synthase [Nitrospirae bacterium]|nr:NDP-sugar synthase [Nitrospirota bacterium]